jgi:ABC-2 type transport system permease protein
MSATTDDILATRLPETARPSHSAGTAMTVKHSPVSTFIALLKREFWEHRGGLWSAQIWTTIVMLALMVLSILIGEAFRFRFMDGVEISSLSQMAMSHIGPSEIEEFREGLGVGLWGLGMINQIVLYFVVLFYCIGALYDERKDRSILFWKSLPATDTQTVLSKFVTAIAVAPLLCLVAVAILHVGFIALIALYCLVHGVNALPLLWQPDVFLDTWGQMLASIPVHMVWAVPGIAWLLLASSWAKRAPFVWAVLLPVLAAVFYGMIESLLRLRLPSAWFWEHVTLRVLSAPGSLSLRPWQWDGDNPFANLVSWDKLTTTITSAETWIGVAIGAGLLAVAIWLRRYRDDS